MPSSSTKNQGSPGTRRSPRLVRKPKIDYKVATGKPQKKAKRNKVKTSGDGRIKNNPGLERYVLSLNKVWQTSQMRGKHQGSPGTRRSPRLVRKPKIDYKVATGKPQKKAKRNKVKTSGDGRIKANPGLERSVLSLNGGWQTSQKRGLFYPYKVTTGKPWKKAKRNEVKTSGDGRIKANPGLERSV